MILYFPPVGAVLGTGPVATEVYLVAWAGPIVIFGLDYLRKLVIRRGPISPCTPHLKNVSP